MTRRTLAIAVGAVALLVAAVPVGRLEGARFDDSQNDGLAAVRREVRLLYQPSLTHYRLDETHGLTCLVYRRGANDLALELCFDGQGRLVEAVDRRGGETKRWSLRPHPNAARIREDPATVENAWRRLVARVRARAVARSEAVPSVE